MKSAIHLDVTEALIAEWESRLTAGDIGVRLYASHMGPKDWMVSIVLNTHDGAEVVLASRQADTAQAAATELLAEVRGGAAPSAGSSE